jgi:hypothetical protein
MEASRCMDAGKLMVYTSELARYASKQVDGYKELAT